MTSLVFLGWWFVFMNFLTHQPQMMGPFQTSQQCMQAMQQTESLIGPANMKVYTLDGAQNCYLMPPASASEAKK